MHTLSQKTLLILLLLVATLPRVLAQEVSIDVSYKMKKHPAFKFKVGRPYEVNLKLGEDTFQMTPSSKDLKQWVIESNGYRGEAQFFADPDKGIGWEIASVDVTTQILLSTDPTDTNDPREFVITSSADRGKYMVFNDEPDCNSEFTLVEPADSPTLLTGVMRTYGTLISNDPCDKGKWRVTLEQSPPDHIILGWAFACIQSINVRFFEE